MRDRPPTATVRLIAGEGLLARRANEIVFSPTGEAGIADALLDAMPGQSIDAVTAIVDAGAAPVESFVAVQWADRVRIAVYGAVELSSDHPSLPRISGSGAGTWVERSLPITGPIVLRCGDDSVLASTSLVEGVVSAGGFEVRIEASTPHEDPRSPDQHGLDLAQPVPSEADVEPPRRTAFAALDENDDATAIVDTSAAGTPTPAASAASASSSTRLTACPTCLAPMESGAIQCPTCGHHLPAESTSVARWQIVFGDGRVESVDRTLVLGRDPRLDNDGWRAVVVDCELVSATHLEVRPVGAEIHLVDLGSRNSTFVLTTGDAQFVPIASGRAHRVGDGTVVQLGRQRFTVVGVVGDSADAATG